MRTIIRAAIVAALILTVSALMPGRADAAVRWPASCARLACVNSHLNNLDQRLRLSNHRQNLRIRALEGSVANLRNRLAAAEQRLDSHSTRLACIGVRAVWQRYTYNYYGNYFEYLNISDQYGTGSVAGPWRLLQERQTDNCTGLFS